MKRTTKQTNKKTAFTIVELLTVMSIIVILIGLLVPALSAAKKYAKYLAQRAQFKGIDDMLADFSNRDEGSRGFPPSGARDPIDASYCGAMKLGEAMVGLDMLGFHPDSAWRADGTNGVIPLYGLDPAFNPTLYETNLRSRWGPFMPIQSAYRVQHVYENTGPFEPNAVILCDVYSNVTNRDSTPGARRKIGMPILYYRADPAGIYHDPGLTGENSGNVYNSYDNQELIVLGKPFQGGASAPHTLSDPIVFYDNMRDHKIRPQSRPYRPDSYVLISAGFDGDYGTADDVYNFDWKAR